MGAAKIGRSYFLPYIFYLLLVQAVFFQTCIFNAPFPSVRGLYRSDRRRGENGPLQARRSLAAASQAGQAGPILIWLTFLASTVIVVLVFLVFVFLAVVVAGSVF